MRKLTIALLALPLATFAGAAMAADPAEGAAKAEVCLDCHDPAADFEGMSAEEIEAAIKGALAGDVKHPPGIEDIEEADAAAVAAYFAAEAAE
jgi:cytochrome c553